MLQIIVKLLGAILMLLGVILIYDARVIVNEYFKKDKQNDYTRKSKIVGTVLGVCGGIMILLVA